MAKRLEEPRQWAPQLSLDQLNVGCWLNKTQQLVIKVEVERYELEVLAGAQNLLDLDHPIALYIEVPLVDRARLKDLFESRDQPIDSSNLFSLMISGCISPD